MSVIRLVMLDRDISQSGLIPSHAIGTVLYAVGRGATGLVSFWPLVGELDPGLEDLYRHQLDATPILEGSGDGLLVINWEHRCIESFQAYQPIRPRGFARRHTGRHAADEFAEVPFEIPEGWHLIDHHFEESRH